MDNNDNGKNIDTPLYIMFLYTKIEQRNGFYKINLSLIN